MDHVLFVRGTEKGEQVYITRSDITAVNKIDYNDLDENDLDEDDDTHVFKVPGYKGKGLRVTADYRVALTNEHRTMIQVFPTEQADELQALLTIRDPVL